MADSIDLSAMYRATERYLEGVETVNTGLPPVKPGDEAQVRLSRPNYVQRPSTAAARSGVASEHSDNDSLIDVPGLATSGTSTPANSVGTPATPHYSRQNSGYFFSKKIHRQETFMREHVSKNSASSSESGVEVQSPVSSISGFDVASTRSTASSKRSSHHEDLTSFPLPTLTKPSSVHQGAAGAISSEQHPAPTLSRPRSSSLSTLQVHRPAARQVERRATLPDIFQHLNQQIISHAEHPVRDLILPSGPRPIAPTRRPPSIPPDEIDVLPPAVADASAPDPEVPAVDSSANSQDSKLSVWSRAAASIEATYYPSEAPPLIMPTAPTDAEKVLYLKTNRLGLYTFGVFSFLSLSAGMWLFVVSNVVFYWFGAVVALLQIYLIISYTVSICGKDYDIEKHRRMCEENPIDPVTAPTVDIYLPCCKEPIEILENTYKHVQQLQWPEGKLKVYVLDDGASEAVQTMATQYGFNYICRDDRPRLKKAGNLRWAFARTSGDFFNIYDADFCPRPDFLHEVMPIHLACPDTAIVQTPQFFRTTTEQTWVESGAGAVQELFYRVVQINRNRWGASICVGSNAVYRREALVEVGGTAEIGFSEDVHTGFYALTRGWKVRYLPLCLACGICPDTPRAFFSQQMRWCMGSTTLLTNLDFWRSNLSFVQKICYLSGMMYYTAISMSIFISPLPGILMLWCRPDYVRFYNLAFAVPSIFYSIIAIRCWSRASFGFNAQFVMVIQSYAYLTAIKDRLFGRALAWVPSGDTKAHKNNKYRNMRILAICWTTSVLGAVAAGATYQILRGLAWYDCLPLLILDAFNLFLAHRFLLWNGKI